MAALIKQTLKKKKKDITSPSAGRKTQEEQEEVNILQLLTSPSAKVDDYDDRPGGETIVIHGSSEGQKVLRVLYRMKSQVTHKDLIAEFLYEHIFKDIDYSKTLFSLTFETTYRNLRSFISYRGTSPSETTKVFKTNINQGSKDKQCTQPKCNEKRKKHSEANCWILHPELKPEFCAQTECKRKRVRHLAEKCWIIHPELKPQTADSSSQSDTSEEDDNDEEDEEDEEVENNEDDVVV